MTTPADRDLIDIPDAIIEWCERIDRLTRDYDFDGFDEDELAQLAFSKAVERVGEPSGRIIRRWPEFAKNHPGLQLSKANAMRNRLAHGYETIELETRRDTIEFSIPELHGALVQVAGSLNHEKP